ncbi:hypothetical protein DFQ11_101164 [Winogradskyella epiphytica]|uniref:Short subunit dehydrogenase n=1 Tax=Winogradskyella epiphytica TaxID=262005 RepID=A0A2V4XL01_9FLAO|nr:hypothetical protein [Winogradskyella epiphytica]PYE82739.1 hypothetical protein DFQ11_101164 [Winogradskyella epiphytica]
MTTADLFSLKGKTAIVRGGINGMGKATALLLAKHNATNITSDV